MREVEEATLNVSGGGGGPRTRPEDTTSIARKYHNMVLGGKVCAAVRMVTNRGMGGAYRPFDLDSKNVKPLLNELPVSIDYGQTMFCLSFPSRDRATAPGRCE
jgi:hypothetical protein